MRKVNDALITIHKWNEDIDKRIDITNKRIMKTNRNVARSIRLNSSSEKSKSVSFESMQDVREQRQLVGSVRGPCKTIKPYHIPLTPITHRTPIPYRTPIPHPSVMSVVSPEKTLQYKFPF